MPDGSSTAHLLRPKLATAIGEGYRLDHFRKGAVAALTVSLATAVASGVSPERGLYTAIVGGLAAERQPVPDRLRPTANPAVRPPSSACPKGLRTGNLWA
jgi:hypothetical protein